MNPIAVRANLAKLSCALLTSSISAIVVAQQFELSFWPGPGAKNAPGFVALHPGPCGEYVTARVDAIPLYQKNAPLMTDRVFELDVKGNVVRRWSIPANTTPDAVSGNDLVLSLQNSYVRVTPQGKLSRETAPPQTSTPQKMQCSIPQEFGNSGYAACWRYTDVSTRAPRILAFEGVCS